MRNVFIFVPNDSRIIDNAIFDINKDPNFSIYLNLKKYFYKKNINMNTVDMGTPTKRDSIYCFDTPFPWNRPAWKLLKESPAKKILFAFEPSIVNPFNYMGLFNSHFDKILTWNDDLVDNKKYFKYNWPQSSTSLNRRSIPFHKKKFLTLINGNKLPFAAFKPFSRVGKELYSKRIEAINYFEKNIPNEFDLYGVGWNKAKKYNLSERLLGFRKYNVYKGKIDNKIDVLAKYKFCLCFENLTNVNGFFTEKLFDCFKARTIPIYWGAENVSEYIPANCFVDFRKFHSYALLIKYLKEMKKQEYDVYIKNINKLLKSSKFKTSWFENGFAKNVYKLLG